MHKLTKTEVDDMFIRLAACQLEPPEWKDWWNQHVDEIKRLISPGDFMRIKVGSYPNPYETMCKSQEAAIRYLGKSGVVIPPNDYYQTKRNQFRQERLQEAIQEYEQQIGPYLRRWEEYRNNHNPYSSPTFNIDQVIGQYSMEPPGFLDEFGYVRNDVCKALIKEQFKRKLVPLAKAYGMKWKQPYTFIRERGGVVVEIKFYGYFRGGGIEGMSTRIMPAYMVMQRPVDYCGLPEDCRHSKYSEEVFDYNNWKEIHHVSSVPLLCEQVDRITRYLAEVVLPTFEQVDSISTFFAKERLEWHDALKIGPPIFKYGWIAPAWEPKPPKLDCPAKPFVQPEYSYMFGVWNLYSGQEALGYEQLENCKAKLDEIIAYNKTDFRMKEKLTSTDLVNYSDEIMSHFARCFLKTRNIENPEKRRQQIISTYQDICGILKRAYRY